MPDRWADSLHLVRATAVTARKGATMMHVCEPIASADRRIGHLRGVRASIAELCVADHKGDPGTPALWLQNTMPENVQRWLTHPSWSRCIQPNRGHLHPTASAQLPDGPS